MSPTTLLEMQFTFSLLLFALVARWYITPALDRLPARAALVPLFLVHALRYLPSTAFAPGQVGISVPMKVMATIAYGDLGSAVLALIAALLLYHDWKWAIPFAWIANIVGALDWLNSSYLAASHRLATFPMGGNWYIINYYVPVIGVIHVLIFSRLLRMRRAPLDARWPVRSATSRHQTGVAGAALTKE